MLASTGDPRLTERLPHMRNFKLICRPGRRSQPRRGHGTVLPVEKAKFVEEWEAISNRSASRTIRSWTWAISCSSNGTTRCCAAVSGQAERLLSLQRADGGCRGLRQHDGKPLFTDLKDLRPTFYGFVVAYKLLGERKYLDAAVRGADWFVRNAVDKGLSPGSAATRASSTTSPRDRPRRPCSTCTA